MFWLNMCSICSEFPLSVDAMSAMLVGMEALRYFRLTQLVITQQGKALQACKSRCRRDKQST